MCGGGGGGGGVGLGRVMPGVCLCACVYVRVKVGVAAVDGDVCLYLGACRTADVCPRPASQIKFLMSVAEVIREQLRLGADERCV